MPYGYQLADQYGSLGPATDARLGREVYSRVIYPGDADATIPAGFPNGRDFNIHIPQFDITKGALISHIVGIADGFNRVYMHCFFKQQYDPANLWRNPTSFPGTWNNDTRILYAQLNIVNPTIGLAVFGYMFA